MGSLSRVLEFLVGVLWPIDCGFCNWVVLLANIYMLGDGNEGYIGGVGYILSSSGRRL